MFVALWEFEVKPGLENRFEKVYGPSGEWAQLFRNDPNYRETRLLRDTSRSLVYTTLDFWGSREAYEFFLQAHQAEYKALDNACKGLTVNERRVGTYEAVEP